jgi:hypothetical protein
MVGRRLLSTRFDFELPCPGALVADLTLAIRLGWERPATLIATTILHPSLRGEPSGRRPRPDDRDWLLSCAKAYSLAAQDAYALASDLARRSGKLRLAASSLRAKGARTGRPIVAH